MYQVFFLSLFMLAGMSSQANVQDMFKTQAILVNAFKLQKATVPNVSDTCKQALKDNEVKMDTCFTKISNDVTNKVQGVTDEGKLMGIVCDGIEEAKKCCDIAKGGCSTSELNDIKKYYEEKVKESASESDVQLKCKGCNVSVSALLIVVLIVLSILK